jgi:hypothetical protein
LDNQLLLGVIAVKYEVGIPTPRNAIVTLQIIADVEIEGEADVIKEWRNVLPKVEAEKPASRLAHQGWDKLTTEERRARTAPATAGRVRSARQKRMTYDGPRYGPSDD